MYQRTTLKIARALKESDIYQGKDLKDIQLDLTPVWLGAVGWLSYTWYISVVLIFINYGFMDGIIGVLFGFIAMSFIPIPWGFYKNIVIKYIRSRINKVEKSNEPNKKFKLPSSELLEELIVENLKILEENIRNVKLKGM
jgi:hypothetical protein